MGILGFERELYFAHWISVYLICDNPMWCHACLHFTSLLLHSNLTHVKCPLGTLRRPEIKNQLLTCRLQQQQQQQQQQSFIRLQVGNR